MPKARSLVEFQQGNLQICAYVSSYGFFDCLLPSNPNPLSQTPIIPSGKTMSMHPQAPGSRQNQLELTPRRQGAKAQRRKSFIIGFFFFAPFACFAAWRERFFRLGNDPTPTLRSSKGPQTGCGSPRCRRSRTQPRRPAAGKRAAYGRSRRRWACPWR